MITQLARVSATADRERATRALTEAFRNDPVCRWIWPEEAVYDRYFGPFVEAFAGAAFEHGSAYASDDGGGAALWLPPGVASDGEALGSLALESIPPGAQEEAFAFLGQQEAQHPHEPHWYLPLIGVEPASQGNGYGSALLEHALAIVDRDRLPAYLEATTERNRALYARFGFEVVGEIQYGSSPAMWPMWRKAR
jgi:ribosomal protein S18 acetylase RimI-like enzyme